MNNAHSLTKPARSTRDDYRVFRSMPTRWADNDIYGHVNNVVYYEWFDTAVNGWLIDKGALDVAASEIVGLVVETGCRYFESIRFPDPVEIGLVVSKLGRSSVTYSIGVFREGGGMAIAQGHFTHVHVDRKSQRPVPIPDAARALMLSIGNAAD
jgi:acyl-CoA thioester hydrolase